METTRPTKAPTGPLKFQPLNDGLGFHPFSDGLPYAPVSKPQAPRVPLTGTGAVAAGRPTFGPIPTLTPAQAPTPAKNIAREQPQLQGAREMTTPMPELAKYEGPHGFGYLFRRVWAYLFDTMLNFTVVGAGIATALWRQDVPADIFLSSGVMLLAGAFAAFFSWALVTSQEIAFGTSIGKRLFGLSLTASASTVMIRAVLFVPMFLLGGLGLLVAIFNRRRSCLHDLILSAQPHDNWADSARVEI